MYVAFCFSCFSLELQNCKWKLCHTCTPQRNEPIVCHVMVYVNIWQFLVRLWRVCWMTWQFILNSVFFYLDWCVRMAVASQRQCCFVQVSSVYPKITYNWVCLVCIKHTCITQMTHLDGLTSWGGVSLFLSDGLKVQLDLLLSLFLCALTLCVGGLTPTWYIPALHSVIQWVTWFPSPSFINWSLQTASLMTPLQSANPMQFNWPHSGHLLTNTGHLIWPARVS